MPRQTTTFSKSQTLTPTKPKLAQYTGFFAVGYILASTIFMMIQTKMPLNSQLVMAVSNFNGT